jgi:hypothetical protein
MSYGDFENRLFIGLYHDEQNGANLGSKLADVCKTEGLPIEEHYQQRFVDQNQEFGDSSGFSGGHLCFALNDLGRNRAKQLISQNESRTLKGRIKSVNRSDWIAVGAFIVSIIGLFN